MITACNNAYNY